MKSAADESMSSGDSKVACLGAAGAIPSAASEHVNAVGIEEEVHPQVDAPPAMDRRFVTAALMLVMMLASMEMTVTSTAMPTIIAELHGLEHYSWVASLYMLACTVTMPLYGRLADVLGRKKVILFATAVFTVGSVLAAYATSMTQLILFRGIQGLGAGGIMPVVLTILADIFTLKERAKIQGLFSALWGTSSLAGPILGAFLVKNFGWRWVFLVNLPFGLLGLAVLVWKYRDRQKTHKTDLDLLGIGLLSIGSMVLLALVSRLGPDGWSVSTALMLAVFGIACLWYFVIHERRTEHAVMPPELMGHRQIWPSVLATFFFGGAFLSLDTFVPLYVQGGRGGGVGQAAAVVTPVMMTWAFSNFLAAPLMLRWGFKKLALIGCSLIIVGFIGLVIGAFYNLSQHVLTGILAVTGFGFGTSSMSYLLGAQNAAQWHQRGIVTSSVSFFRTIGGAMSIGLFGTLFNVLAKPDLDKLSKLGVKPAEALDPHLQASLSPEAHQLIQHAIGSSLQWVFVAMVAIAIAQLLVTFYMSDVKPSHAVRASDAMEGAG